MSYLKITSAFVIISLLSFSCPSKKKITFNPPVVIDSLPVTNNLINISSIYLASYHIETIFAFGDTCFLFKQNFRWGSSFFDIDSERTEGLKIFVDTMKVVSIAYRKQLIEMRTLSTDTAVQFHKGYTCFIYNESDSGKWIELQDGGLEIIQEAKDEFSYWRPIQAHAWSWCGNSYSHLRIDSKHSLAFKVPLFSGKLYTDIRLKVHSKRKIYYSNTFKGFVNIKQFEIPKSLLWGDKLMFNVNFLERE